MSFLMITEADVNGKMPDGPYTLIITGYQWVCEYKWCEKTMSIKVIRRKKQMDELSV